MNGPCVSGSEPIFGSSTDDARLHWGVCEVRLPRNATTVGKNGALQRVGPAKTSRRDNGVWRRVVHSIFRTRMSWQKGANGLVAAALRGRRAALSDQGPVGWQDRSGQAHRAVAGWAARPGCGAGRSGIRGRPGVELEWHSGMDLNALALGFGGRMSAAVDELDRRAITPQANGAEEIMHLLTREDGGKEVVILGADLGEDAPQGALEQLDKVELRAGQRLADRLWLPVLLELDVKQVVAQMRFLQGGWIALEVLVQHAHRTVVRVTSALGIEAQCEQLRVCAIEG